MNAQEYELEHFPGVMMPDPVKFSGVTLPKKSFLWFVCDNGLTVSDIDNINESFNPYGKPGRNASIHASFPAGYVYSLPVYEELNPEQLTLLNKLEEENTWFSWRLIPVK